MDDHPIVTTLEQLLAAARRGTMTALAFVARTGISNGSARGSVHSRTDAGGTLLSGFASEGAIDPRFAQELHAVTAHARVDSRDARLVEVWLIEDEGADRIYTSTRPPEPMPGRRVYVARVVLPRVSANGEIDAGVADTREHRRAPARSVP